MVWHYLCWNCHFIHLSLNPTHPLPQPPYFPTDFLPAPVFYFFLSLPFLPSQFSSHPSSSGCPPSLPLSLNPLQSPLHWFSLSNTNMFTNLFLLHSLSASLSHVPLKHDTSLPFSLVQGRSPTNAIGRDAHGNFPVQMSSKDTRESTAGSDPTCVLYATGILHDPIT